MGRPTQIDTISPSLVSWVAVKDRLVPHVSGQPRTPWPLGDFWHLPVSWLLPPGSNVAMSPTEYGREAIGAGLAAEQFGSKFFGDNAYPVPVIESETALTREQADTIKQTVIGALRGGSRQPLVWSKGLRWLDAKLDPNANQFIDLLRFEVEQACRLYGVPPSMVYAAVSGQNVTYANVTQSDLHFLKYSVGVWLQDLEDFWTAAIPAPQIVKVNADAVLRMDAKARAELHEIRLRTGTRTVNEVRRLEDEDPFDDPMYDEPGLPGGSEPAAPAAADPSPPDGGAP
jgi:HK97 family phage portal protein